MPSIYAHYLFGNQVLPRLPADVRGAISRNRPYFDAGLQGPDFLFYHQGSSVEQGRRIHQQTGHDFFTNACRTLSSDSSEEVLVYLYGLLAHYCLDSVTHPFICCVTEEGPVTHLALEAEFERYLMARSGISRPHAFRRSKLFRFPKEGYRMISRFFPGVSADQIAQSVTATRYITDLITCGNPLHRAAALAVLHALGGDRPDLMIPPTPNTACSHRNKELSNLYNRALEEYPQLLEQLRDYLMFREPLGEAFLRPFG